MISAINEDFQHRHVSDWKIDPGNPYYPPSIKIGAVMPGKQTVSNEMFIEAIGQVVDTILECPEDEEGNPDTTAYDPLKEELGKQIISLVEQLRASHTADITKLQKAAGSKVSKSSSTTKTKTTGKYAQFVGALKYLKPDSRGTHEKLANTEVTVGDNFKDKGAACAMRYYDYKDKLKFTKDGNEQCIEGQTMTLADLYDVLVKASSLDEKFNNGMTRAGLMWGLTSEEDHTKIMNNVEV